MATKLISSPGIEIVLPNDSRQNSIPCAGVEQRDCELEGSWDDVKDRGREGAGSPTTDHEFILCGKHWEDSREKIQMSNFLPRKAHWLCSTPMRKNHPRNLHGRVWRYFYDRNLGFMCKGANQATEIVLPSAALLLAGLIHKSINS